MKTIKNIIFLIGLLISVPLMATQTSPVDKEVTTQTNKIDYKDAFLSFALEKAKTYSDKAEVAVGKAVDYTVKEAPEVAKEYLTWRAWYHGLHFLFPVLGSIILAIVFLLCFRKATWDNDGPSVYDILTIVTGVSNIFMFTAVCLNIDHLYSFVQINVAPRVYMIEQVMHLFGK